MKTVKINFVDFYKGFEKENNDFVLLLKKHYNVEISDKPDYLFYSVFGSEHVKYDCVKVFFTGECVVPDFNLCDYAIGFDYLSFGDRYIRVPLYQLFQYKDALHMAVHRGENLISKSKFCSFVCSNDQGMPERKQMLELLSRYKRVDSGGRFLNNIGGPVADKLAFDQEHKFSLAFENCIGYGYTTEKIIQAFAAGTIPIYFGNPIISKELNTRAFINCADFESLDEVIKKVIEIDNDDNQYEQMVREPIFLGDVPSLDNLEQFLVNIIAQPLNKARRRPYNTRITEKEEQLKIVESYNRLIGRKIKKIKAVIRRIRHRSLLR